MNSNRSLIIFALILFPVMALADGSIREITVTGRAEVRVDPNEVVLSFAVETLNEDLNLSKQGNDKIVTAALDAVGELGLDANQIKTDHIRIEPVYANPRSNREFLGFKVTNSVEVTFQDIGLVEDVLSSVLEAGVNRVNGITFHSTDFRQHRDEAMMMALDAAKEKAQAMARQLGSQIGKPISIKEGTSGRFPNPSNTVQNSSTMSDGMNGPIAPGKLSIPAVVTVTFEMVD
jgi:uncharacterized protein YggE